MKRRPDVAGSGQLPAHLVTFHSDLNRWVDDDADQRTIAPWRGREEFAMLRQARRRARYRAALNAWRIARRLTWPDVESLRQEATHD